MKTISIAPDQVDDCIEEARRVRDELKQSYIIRLTPPVPPGIIYKMIEEYVEAHKDMVVLADKKYVYIKAVYSGN